MKKECHYCGNGFDAKRSDAKYCTATCKQEAYLLRKSNPNVNNGAHSNIHNGNNNNNGYGNRRQSRKDVKASIPLSGAQLDKLLNGQRTNHQMLDFLLSEKDSSGDIKAENGQLRIELKFLERDLRYEKEKTGQLSQEVDKLSDEIKRITLKMESSEKGLMNQVVDFCKENPIIVTQMFSKTGNAFNPNKISSKETKSSTETLSGNSAPNESDDILERMKNATEEEKQQINAITEIMQFVKKMHYETEVPFESIRDTLLQNESTLKLLLATDK